jgi:drug/metabolite transporter (DMT)-like permease
LTRRGWVLFIALGVVWGVPYLLIKVAVRELTPASLVFLRTAIGAGLLLPFVLRGGRAGALLAHWRPIALFTVVEMAIPWFLLSDAERRVTSSFAGLFMASVPLVGAVIARFLGRHEPLGARRVLGLGVGLAGVVALLGLDVGGGDAFAVVELVIVVVGYAIGPVIVARRLADLPTLDVVAASLALCAVGYAPFALAELPRAQPSVEAVVAVVVLGVVCTVVAFLLFFRLIAEVGPVRSTVITYVNPAVAVLAGVTLLDEPFTLGTALGFVLILAGSWLATGASPQPPAAVAEDEAALRPAAS